VPSWLWERKKIIYDCMDHAVDFARSEHDRLRLTSLEDRLLSRADLVMCSSDALIASIKSRKPSVNPALVENGLDDSWLNATIQTLPRHVTTSQSSVVAHYFGTISHWIDWDLVKAALETELSLQIHMFGPVETPPCLFHPRLIIHPPVAHSAIPRLSEAADFFIMPFKRNSLVEHVNPVKIYEYIALNKPIVAIDYPGTRRFLPWVNLYSTEIELITLIGKISSGEISFQNESSAIDAKNTFLKSNTWKSRALCIDALTQSLFEISK
jgi:glycosyltransferase involved in cell wall biosynthesis